MHKRPSEPVHPCVLIAVLAAFSGLPVAAQDVLTDPPNAASGGGQTVNGTYSLDNIESINASNGNVGLRLPVAHLPAGPGGFSAGVNLVYNSAIFDVQTSVPNSSFLQMSYVPSAHGGGWNYSYKYTLWSQTRVSLFTTATCGAVSSTEAANWYKTVLATPDGANHALRLVGALNSSGGTYTGTLSSDAGQSYALYDFAGYTNLNCGLNRARFAGTLIFATSDSTYIRVEANTVANTWIAYFPNGTQISGPIIITAGHAVDSDASKITDRNGNALNIVGRCVVGTACTETLTDLQLRVITMSYASNASGTWTDSITAPGPPLPSGQAQNVITKVNWNTGSPYALPYYCQAGPTGAMNTAVKCYLTQTASFVNSIQLPPASTGGTSTIYTFGYSPVDNNPYSWGELHLLGMNTGTDPAVCEGTTASPGHSCQAQWNVTYRYAFDQLTGLPTSPSSVRPPGTAINPIASKTVSYVETIDTTGATQTQYEKTTYIVPVPSNFYNYPTITTSPTVNTGLSVNEVIYPDGSFTQTYTANLCPSGVRVRDLCVAVPYQIINRDNSLTEMMWASNNPAPGAPGVPAGALFNPYVQYRVDTPNAPAGARMSRITQAQQDQNGNTLSTSEYDWVPYTSITHDAGTDMITAVCPSSSPCSPTRTTATSFTPPGQTALPAYWTHAAPPNLRVPYSTSTGGLKSSYTYDGNANLKEMDQTDSVTSTTIKSLWTYQTNGNVLSATDPNSNATQITYGCGTSNNLYPATVVAAGILTTAYNFDCTSGFPKSVTDQDNHITTAFTFDSTGRTTKVEQTGGTLDRVTTTAFDDVNLAVTTTQDDTPTNKVVSTTYFDALGRVHSTLDALGRRVLKLYRYGSNGVSYELTSNPYTGTTATGWTLKTTTLNLPMGTSLTFPIVTVTGYDGATLPAPWGGNTNATGTVSTVGDVYIPGSVQGCAATATQTTDAAGNVRSYCMDGLGRLSGVIEPDGMLANYTYDVLNNLTGVSAQCLSGHACLPAGPTGQTRTFTYSALSRLQTATNPESGLVSYTYDNNGNVKSRQDGNRTNSYLYDPLNRLTGKCYGTSSCTAPSVAYIYDQSFKGALSSVSYQGNSTSYAYDGLGRISGSTQFTAFTAYPFSYTYTMTDQLQTITYPSGRKITYGLDAVDQVTSITGVLNGTSTTYATGITYTAAGDLATLPMNNGVIETHTYNTRLQPTGIAAGSLLSLGYNYCPSGATFCPSGNTGSPQTQTIVGSGLNLRQTYSYNSLNRLTGTTEKDPLGNTQWSQVYGYDPTGNQYVSNLGLPALTNETPQSASWFSSTNNRVTAWTYDTPGNAGQIGQMARTFTYDSEDRQVTATINGVVTNYTYDGNGDRVMKTGSSQTMYVYDAFGNLAAEYSTLGGGSPCGTLTCYLTTDQLGSTRLLMDSSGNAAARYDYEPFGTEIPAGVGGRTPAMGFATPPDSFNLKFTGQVRDAETGLDYFHARYYSAAQGRFQSVDPGNAGADPSDPQTWNGYAYVNNNPMMFTDPDGEGIFGAIFGFFGGLFGGPWGALAGAGVGNAMDAVIWGPGAVGIPGTPLNLGTLIGGGGISGPGGGVYGGGSGGGMVFSFSPIEHFGLTRLAGGSWAFSMGVVLADWGTQGTHAYSTHIHAMGGLVPPSRSSAIPRHVTRYHEETCAEAYAGTLRDLARYTLQAQQGDTSAAARAVHTIQDSYASGHQYQTWEGGLPSSAHLSGDWSPSVDQENAAVAATRRYLDALQGRIPMQDPGAYLYPKPGSCK